MTRPKPKVSTSNVLPNTYIPVLPKKVLGGILARLPKASLIELMYLWPKLVNTQPHIEGRKSGSQKELNGLVVREAQKFKKEERKVTKRKIIDRILFEFWPRGLNLLQLSQIDCQLIVDRPNAFYWIRSTAVDTGCNEVSIVLDPKEFLGKLAADLNHLYMSYIYICKHSILPLMIIRVQVFDLQAVNTTFSSSRPHITSHKPYFLAISLNSPHVVHSVTRDNVSDIILQAVERNLPQTPQRVLRLETPVNQRPVRSLETMHILYGNSRFGNSLGIWTPYADGTADISPLGAIEKHKCLQQQDYEKESSIGALDRLKQIANLRFKGSKDGKLKSDVLFEENNPSRRSRKTRNILASRTDFAYLNDGDEDDVLQGFNNRNEFSSIAPVQYTEFIIAEKFDKKTTFRDNASSPNDDSTPSSEKSSIRLKLTGNDIYAGLHELSVQSTIKDEMILDPSTVPEWLTGEQGAEGGTVKNGKIVIS